MSNATTPQEASVKEAFTKVAIIGPTNAGKSSVFNTLTGSYSDVANYSQTTVHCVKTRSAINGKTYLFCDTPGISSLSVISADESETRDTLLVDRPDIIVFVADATRLKRSLILYAQLVDLGAPMIFVLNKMDMATAKGLVIDTETLADLVKAPVIEASAVHSIGFEKIEGSLERLHRAEGAIRYNRRGLEDAIGQIAVGGLSRAEALLLLEGNRDADRMIGDRLGEEALAVARQEVARFVRRSPGVSVRQLVFTARERWADRIVDEVTTAASFLVPDFGHYAAWASRHPVYGWPIVAVVMWLTFQGVGNIANIMAGALDGYIFAPLTDALSAVITYPLLHEFLLGDFGVLTMGVMNAVVTVVPILIVFFLIVNLLEEVGYLPNLSVLANRMFSYAGLTGKATLTMSLGFGCGTMATMTSRMLESRKERVIACFLIALGVPCAVQLGVMIAILQSAGFAAQVLVVGTVLLTQVVAGMLLNRLIKSDRTPDFIMELPPFRAPQWRNVVRKTTYRVKSFLIEAVPLFMLGAALMFVLDKTGLLQIIKAITHPVITGILSLPDKATEVFILVISRRELGAVYFKDMADAGELSFAQIVVGLTVMTLFIPCISNTMAMIKELGLKTSILINGSIILVAIAMGGLLNGALHLI
ncbi:MAG: ferrous iron transport protein B [Nitrospinae bacterium]|nr:ferrous iron transport protein B [Nitrospinota bacterium]